MVFSFFCFLYNSVWCLFLLYFNCSYVIPAYICYYYYFQYSLVGTSYVFVVACHCFHQNGKYWFVFVCLGSLSCYDSRVVIYRNTTWLQLAVYGQSSTASMIHPCLCIFSKVNDVWWHLVQVSGAAQSILVTFISIFIYLLNCLFIKEKKNYQMWARDQADSEFMWFIGFVIRTQC